MASTYLAIKPNGAITKAVGKISTEERNGEATKAAWKYTGK